MMVEEYCYWMFCFTPISEIPHGRIFGFSEYLAAVALLAVLYTVTDTRYKFRIAVTPGNLHLTSYCLLALIGLQSLLTEVWIAEGWWVPVAQGLSYHIWQMIFGLLFLGTFLTWMYYAFIRPPIYSKRNALRYAQVLYSYIVRGFDDELKVIAHELSRSAPNLIRYARGYESNKNDNEIDVQDYANDILLLIGNRRFCRHIVTSSPITAQIFFTEMAERKKFNIPIGQFSRHITSEAIAYRESFLYAEAEGYTSGLLGYLKPVSSAVYGNFNLVESLARFNMSPLDVDYRDLYKWNSEQWEAYCRAALITIGDYLNKGGIGTPNQYSIVRALNNVETALHDLHKLDGLPSIYEMDIYNKLSVVMDFVTDVIELVDNLDNPPKVINRVRGLKHQQENIYDYLANLVFKICCKASSIGSPEETCWSIHHNIIWGSLFGLSNGKASKVVCHKLRRLLYDEITRLTAYPNYKSAKILGFCLNLMLDATKPNGDYGRLEYALAKAVQNWTKKNYLKLRKDNLEVGKSVLIGSISYDSKGSRLVMTYRKGLSKVAPKSYLQLSPAKT